MFADDRFGAVCGTGLGEAFMRLALARVMVIELEHGMDAAAVAAGAIAAAICLRFSALCAKAVASMIALSRAA